ncbi:MAG: HNH endonuclease family protein [Mycoplasmoidaceae bacterium]
MSIKIKAVLKSVNIKELVEGYHFDKEDKFEESKDLFCYKGKLKIRPKYQREFIYKPEQEKKVIETILKNCPLSVMYWLKTNDNNWELLDGQQRTLSICRYLNGKFGIGLENNFFSDLKKSEQDSIENYELLIYEITGDSKERMDWFETVNFSGEKLNKQELLNANFSPSEWLEDAKSFFSKRKGNTFFDVQYKFWKGSINRQEILEQALEWYADKWKKEDILKQKNNFENNENKYTIKDLMNKFREDKENNAEKIINYYKEVIEWVKNNFCYNDFYHKSMIDVEWGILFNEYKNEQIGFTPQEINEKIIKLINIPNIEYKSIYVFILSKEIKNIFNRSFTQSDKQKKFNELLINGIVKCENENCNETFSEAWKMEADHVKPYSKGGSTDYENLQLLCKCCNKKKSNEFIDNIFYNKKII